MDVQNMQLYFPRSSEFSSFFPLSIKQSFKLGSNLFIPFMVSMRHAKTKNDAGNSENISFHSILASESDATFEISNFGHFGHF